MSFGDVDRTLIAQLSITSWAFALGGQHFCVRVRSEDRETFDVTYEMTEVQACKFNKKDGGLTYAKGDVSSRFWDRDDAIASSVKQVREKWPDVRLIIDGDALQPQPIAYCSDEEIGARLKAYGDEFEGFYKETNDPWAHWPKRCEELEDLWDGDLERLAPKRKTKAKKTKAKKKTKKKRRKANARGCEAT